MIPRRILTTTLLCVLCHIVQSARILGVFPMAAKSHYILGSTLMRGLAEAGHDVTLISPYEMRDPPKNGTYRDVILTGFEKEYERGFDILHLQKDVNINNDFPTSLIFWNNFPTMELLKIMNLLESDNGKMWQMMNDFYRNMAETVEKTFEVENVKQLLKSNEQFDVIISEQFLIDGLKIFSNIYKAPLIILNPLGANPWINNAVGNPTPYSYIPAVSSDYTPRMSFWEKLGNTAFYLMMSVVEEFFHFPLQDQAIRKHYPNAPDIRDIYRNVSLVLLNSHESLNQPVPHVPNMIQIGGFHVTPPKKLPKDLQDFLDNAKEGVILFSLGSNLKSKDFPPHKREAVLRAFRKLKEQVLWKWEDEEMPGKPANVKLEKWLPQQSILAHPNVKLFITHSGLLSTTETVYHGVPILAMPVFGDQHMNARLAVQSGYALALPYADPSFSEEELSKRLNELLTNPKYRENAKRRSRLFHDRPMKPMDTAVYWVEYVARYGGAPHLKVAGANLPWYIYHSLDVVSFLLVISTLILYVSYISLRKVLNRLKICCKTKTKPKKE